MWINELKDSDVLPPERRTDFLEQVFWNIHDIIAVNTRLRDALTKRQKAYAVVERIGDIMLDAVPHFGPFVSYGAHQLYGKYEFEKEKAANPAFAAFVDAAERRPESRKLELNGYLTKPTTRLARYPLLLEAVLKHTPPDSPDAAALPQAIAVVREFLGRVNVESGRTENRFNLLQLDQQLVFRPGEQVDLRLQEEGRELVYKGALSKKGGGAGQDAGDLQLYLFDHALLMVKQKSKHEQYKVYRRPIPLELLLISSTDDYAAQTARQAANRANKTLTKSTPYVPAFQGKVEGGKGFAITFVHLGRKFYQITLWASTYVSQRKWVEHIGKQQERMRARSAVFAVAPLSEGFFTGANKVNCAAPYNGGQRVVYGTDDGVYLSDMRAPGREPVKVLGLLDVAQVDVLDEYELLIVLSERQVITFPLDALDPLDPLAGLKRAKRISSHTSFFKAGVCLGKVLVCVVKSSPLSSTIKTLEPIDQSVRGRSKPTFRKLLQGGNDTLKLFREFYIPVESSSIHFLKTKLCVGCSKGFEIVDLETLDTQGLLDPADESLDFIKKRENLRPMAIYRIDNEFLLCYDGEWRACGCGVRTDEVQNLRSTSIGRGGGRARSLWCSGRGSPPASVSDAARALNVVLTGRSLPLPLRPRVRPVVCRGATRPHGAPLAGHPGEQPAAHIRGHAAVHHQHVDAGLPDAAPPHLRLPVRRGEPVREPAVAVRHRRLRALGAHGAAEQPAVRAGRDTDGRGGPCTDAASRDAPPTNGRRMMLARICIDCCDTVL